MTRASATSRGQSAPSRRAAKRAARRRANEQAMIQAPVLHYGSNIAATARFDRRFANVQTLNAPAAPKRQRRRRRRARRDKTPSLRAPLSGLHPHVAEYLRQVADPNQFGHGKVPLNPMGVPTNNSFTYKMFNTFGIDAAATGASEVTFFPGHNYTDAADPVDLVSAHAYTQNINGTIYVVGPTGDGVRTPTMGYTATGIGVDNFVATTNVVNRAPILPAETAPFTASDQEGAHTRWRLQSMQVLIENVTPIGTAAGDIVVVQPDHKLQDTGVGTYMKFASFRRYNATQPVTVNWLPRSEDLYWWHSDNGTAAIGTIGAGIRILLNNTSGSVQNYRISWVANFEVSGARYAALSTPTLDSAQGQLTVPRAINAARNHSGTTDHLVAHGEVEAASNDSGLAKGLGPRLRALYKTIPKGVTDHIARAFGSDSIVGKAAGVVAGAMAAMG